ncbi:MAG: NAD(P)/FAD-dependent oxidoreductase [Opitutaceae bacterium]|nr:NAD(P)/FAD-dependent oxidoreductase [Verrucomicrobiales bacterium]
MVEKTHYDVLVIGGGAAGLMCAIQAGQRGRSVGLVEHSERIGKKILISGGGRCNFTNLDAGPENYLSANPDFCKSALARYTPQDFIALVEKHGIAYHEKKLGQLFCDLSSRQIVEMLEAECREAHVDLRLNCRVEKVEKPLDFRIQTSHGLLTAKSLVIATGGLSFPKLGATDFGYRVASQFGLKLRPPQPALVPFTLDPASQRDFGELSGLSIDAIASNHNASFRENILFTHRGLSGPAILQISNFWRGGESIEINLLPGRSAHDLLLAERREKKELITVLSQHLPRRFVQTWSDRFAPSKPMLHYSNPELESIATQLNRWSILPAGTEGYAKAEVTVGGVDTSELSSKTMESRKVLGLFFIGEVVDVTGWLGGYNFQWAWASGHAAGQAA